MKDRLGHGSNKHGDRPYHVHRVQGGKKVHVGTVHAPDIHSAHALAKKHFGHRGAFEVTST